MKKIFAAAILTTALFIGIVNADIPDYGGAVAAPKEINHADSIYYPQINFYELTSTADRIILTHYPTYQQTTDYSCGATVVLSVLNYFDNREFDEPTLIKILKTKPKVGTSLGNMVKFFKSLGWEVQSSLDTSPPDEFEFQKFVVENLKAGKPIIVENVEWGGHWRVIIGYDSLGTADLLYDDVLIFADPYDTSDHNQDGFGIESFDRFYSMWFDHCILPENERNQAWLIATPKGET